jgi:DNA-binding NarL/FixJ family response regulator
VAGRALVEREPATLTGWLERALDGEDDVPPALRRVPLPGGDPHWIALQRPTAASPDERAHAVAQRWGVTRRQTDVLAELARGRSNGHIARRLGCAEGTVELHVTGLLEKAGCRSRAELVARYWTTL